MKVSVITITRNNLHGLKRTVASVVGQTYTDYEYIVIDGASTDGSKEFLQSQPGIDRLISEPDKGIYNAMNKGIALAQGEYCIFMNSGDTFHRPDVLQRVAGKLNGADFYIGRTIVIKGKKKKVEVAPSIRSLSGLIRGSINHQSTFTRTRILQENPYNEDFKIAADREKFLTEWLLCDRSYVPLETIISKFYLDGVSAQNRETVQKEMNMILDKLIPKHIQKGLPTEDELSPLENKINYAMSLPPIQRDLKLLRNAFKFLIKDIIYAIKKGLP